jgi:hypothetical protein
VDSLLEIEAGGIKFKVKRLLDNTELLQLGSAMGEMGGLKDRYETLKAQMEAEMKSAEPKRSVELFDALADLEGSFSRRVSNAISEAMNWIRSRVVEGDLTTLSIEGAGELLNKFNEAHFLTEGQRKN